MVTKDEGDERQWRSDLLNSVRPLAASLAKIERQLRKDPHAQYAPRADAAAAGIIEELQKQAIILEKIATVISQHGSAPALKIDAYSTVNTNLSVSSAEPNAIARDQIDPTVDVKSYFPRSDTTIQLALATVPDPRVPRHRRQYDNTITAINKGMLQVGYVLDRYAFPWSRELRPAAADKKDDGGHPTTDRHSELRRKYGLLILGATVGGSSPNNSPSTEVTSVRALTVVAKTGTYGAQSAALRAALIQIDRQLQKRK